MDSYLSNGVYTIYTVQNMDQTIHVYHHLDTWRKATKSSLGTWYIGNTNGDDNHERFYVENNRVGYKFICMANDLVIDVWRWDIIDNNYPIQWPNQYNSSLDKEYESQIWDLNRDANLPGVVNGVAYASHKATNYWFREGHGNPKKRTLVWSMHGGNSKYPEGWLAMEPDWGGATQRFVLIKDIFVSNAIEAPSNVGLAVSPYADRRDVISVGSAITDVYPYWECSGNKYQVSYRWRGRRTGSNDFGGWSLWYAVADADTNVNGSLLENGWGNPWIATTVTTGSGRVRTTNSPIKINIDQGDYDKKEIELCVRQFNIGGKTIDNQWHNTVSRMIYKDGLFVVYRPNLSCSDLGFSPKGLIFSLTSDFRRNGNRATINYIIVNGKTLVSNFNVSDLDYTGNGATVRIPMNNLSFIPTDGDTAYISVTYSTIDGTWTYNFTKEITYNASYGLSINPTFSTGEGQTQLGHLNGSYTSAQCWLLVEHEGRPQFVECERGADGNFVIVPPVGVKYQLFFAVENSSGWGTKTVIMPPIKGFKHIIFNWNGGYAVLPWDTKSQWGLERDSNAVQTQGRLFESVFFGKGSKRPFTVTGRLLKGDRVPHATFEDFEKLSVSDYAVVRFPTGGRYDISIEKVSFTQDHSQYREVTINGREVT